MAGIEIPLNSTNQTFSITLGGVEYQLTLVWRDIAGWALDIASSTGNAIISGIPLVTGADLLQQYAHLGFNGALIVASDIDINSVPTENNLGSGGHVYFITG